ncbi:MAG: hypothetical protein LBR23_10225 [Spirochaetaceae bacterium]|jgi:uncharacterized protein (DUF4415 family)|nr:hypothetical protein [Spirochaetaceae bacterium]
MTEERIAELLKFKTRNYADCPPQTAEQLRKFHPRYPEFIRLDQDIFAWLRQTDTNYEEKANTILRQAMASVVH